MSMTEEILTVARCFSEREWTEAEEEIMTTLCQAALDRWTEKLREELEPADCRGPLVTACAWSALAAMQTSLEAGGSFPVSSFTAGDLTVRRAGGRNAASRSLEAQAQALMEPYLQDGAFAFLEVAG